MLCSYSNHVLRAVAMVARKLLLSAATGSLRHHKGIAREISQVTLVTDRPTEFSE